MKKKKHLKKRKQNYSWITLLKTVIFALPVVLYISVVCFIVPTPNSGFIVIGGIGTVFLGVSLVSFAGQINDMYFGHIITFGLLGVGAVLLFPSVIILYTPSLYAKFDEQYVTQYVIVWAALIVSAIWYMFFRMQMSTKLRSMGLSHTRLKKLLSGEKNYWWYYAVNQEIKLGWLYYFNKFFTVIFVAVFGIQFLLGWAKIMCLVTTFGTAGLCVSIASMFGMSCVTKDGAFSIDASTVVVGILLPLATAYAIITNFLSIA